MWVTVEDCARWLDTTAEMVRILGMRGRFAISVDPHGVITHVALPQPNPEETDPESVPEARGRLSLTRDAGGSLSLLHDADD